MLNLSRKGTDTSAGVSQMTMPSRYRSFFACGVAVDVVCPEAPPGSVAGGGVAGSGPADCPEADVEQSATNIHANATGIVTTARRSTARIWRSIARKRARRSAEHDGLSEASLAGFLVL